MTQPTPTNPFPNPMPGGPNATPDHDHVWCCGPLEHVAALEATDRDLLAAVHRWARSAGWAPHDWLGWINAPTSDAATLAVRAAGEGTPGAYGLSIFSRATPTDPWPTRAEFWPAATVRQAVDVLCAIDVLPVVLSSQFIAGMEWADRIWPTAATYAALGA